MIDDKLQRMPDDELVKLTTPYYNQLSKQGEMCDNDTIDDKQLKAAQHPVTAAANAAVRLRLEQELYRAKWDYKDTYRADKWAHKDKVQAMKQERRELVKSRKAEREAAKEAQRAKRKAERAARRAAKEVASETVALAATPDRVENHLQE